MINLTNSFANRVFHYFNEICAIPHGSGNMKEISNYCVDFAKSNGLKYVVDNALNVVIYKNASKGYEHTEPIILQGHLDMVCQKKDGVQIDFLKDGIRPFIDGDFIKAEGTTLGADNGIAVAMIMSILENNNLSHPPIEAVFTTDEEIGLLGASAFDTGLLSATKMINLDSESPDVITVSCAGGSDFTAIIPFKRVEYEGTKVTLTVEGLQGGHSGVMIDKGRVNADILSARILNQLNILSMVGSKTDFELISINGGDKGNAIPLKCEIELCAKNPERFKNEAEKYIEIIKTEIAHREPQFKATLEIGKTDSYAVISEIKDLIITTLLCIPNGIMEMSAEIKDLVETSLNLGILKTEEDKIIMSSALRSNKKSALKFLEDKMVAYFGNIACEIKTGGHYPPWEFNPNSQLVELYKQQFERVFGGTPKVEAIHAGLECGVFADSISGFDCISVGPEMYDIHTADERLSISSTENLYKLLIEILAKCQ